MRARRQLSGRRATAALATLALAGGLLAGCSKDGPDGTLKDFLTGWRSGDLHTVGFVGANGGSVAAADVVKQLHDLSGDLAKQSLVLSEASKIKTSGDLATGAIKLDWTLPGGA